MCNLELFSLLLWDRHRNHEVGLVGFILVNVKGLAGGETNDSVPRLRTWSSPGRGEETVTWSFSDGFTSTEKKGVFLLFSFDQLVPNLHLGGGVYYFVEDFTEASRKSGVRVNLKDSETSVVIKRILGLYWKTTVGLFTGPYNPSISSGDHWFEV